VKLLSKAHRGELSINTELMLALDMVCARRMGLAFCKADDHRLKIHMVDRIMIFKNQSIF